MDSLGRDQTDLVDRDINDGLHPPKMSPSTTIRKIPGIMQAILVENHLLQLFNAEQLRISIRKSHGANRSPPLDVVN
jgi:hypothetical protein